MEITIQDKKYTVVGEIKDNKAMVDILGYHHEVVKKEGVWTWAYLPTYTRDWIKTTGY